MLSWNFCSDASTLSSMQMIPLPPSWHIKFVYVISRCILNSLHILESTFWNSFLVHFKNGPQYLTRRTVQVFMPLMRFLLQFQEAFSFVWDTFFFFYLHWFARLSFQNSQVLLIFFSFERSNSWFGCTILSVIFIMSIAKFLGQFLLLKSFFFHLRDFHTSISWWFSTGVWVTASLLKFPELLVFGTISTML